MQTTILSPLGADAFYERRAEKEEAWLPQAYVKPNFYNRLLGMRSFAVVGQSGSGKTALRKKLEYQLADNQQDTPVLLVEWPINTNAINQPGLVGLRLWFEHGLDACARAALRSLVRSPQKFTNSPPWFKDAIGWFIHQHLLDDKNYVLGRLSEGCADGGNDVLRELMDMTPRPLLAPNASETRLITVLVDVLQHLGMQGVVMTIDGLEPLVKVDEKALGDKLNALLSALALFEERGFSIKIFAPRTLEDRLAASNGILRRRLDIFRLEWSTNELMDIVRARMALATGQASFDLSKVYPEEHLLNWLEDIGGNTPRGWLEKLYPVVDQYLSQEKPAPLTSEDWSKFQPTGVPLLRVEEDTGRVFTGQIEVTNIQPQPLKILRYLYANAPRICTRSELYYRAHLELPQEPVGPQDDAWQAPKFWRDLIDTNIWRLRKMIEPQGNFKPIYIITVKGKGIRLVNTDREIM